MINSLQYLCRRLYVRVVATLVQRSPARSLIEIEMDRWILLSGRMPIGGQLADRLHQVLYADHMDEYRNILYVRLGEVTKGLDRFLLALSKLMFRPRESLTINCPSIGPGVIIKHGFETNIDAEKVGEGCIIFHDVFIGIKNVDGGRPTLGKCVHVSAGARILGPITIGDHSVIAANAVVTRDVPVNSLALGVPARIVIGMGNKAEYIANGTIPAEPHQAEPMMEVAEPGVTDAA